MLGPVERLRTLFRYRQLLYLLVLQDLKLRYRRSLLGFLWSLLNPLLTMATIAVVFQFVIRIDIESYAVHLLASMLPWGFFATTLSVSSLSILHQEHLIRSQPIPRLVLPLSAAASNLFNLVVSMIALLVILGPVLAIRPSLAMLSLPLAFLCLLAFTIGLGAMVAAATVYLRDLQHILTVVLPAWMYASPVLYPLEVPGHGSVVPEAYHFYFKLNPMYHLLQLFVQPIYWGRAPSLEEIGIAVSLSVVVLAAGLAFFWWREDDLVFHL